MNIKLFKMDLASGQTLTKQAYASLREFKLELNPYQAGGAC